MKNEAEQFMSTVKVGPKGQIVIPKEIRDMFAIEPGDSLVIMADSQKGIAIQKRTFLTRIANAIFNGRGQELYPDENVEGLQDFANTIQNTLDQDKKE